MKGRTSSTSRGAYLEQLGLIEGCSAPKRGAHLSRSGFSHSPLEFCNAPRHPKCFRGPRSIAIYFSTHQCNALQAEPGHRNLLEHRFASRLERSEALRDVGTLQGLDDPRLLAR